MQRMASTPASQHRLKLEPQSNPPLTRAGVNLDYYKNKETETTITPPSYKTFKPTQIKHALHTIQLTRSTQE